MGYSPWGRRVGHDLNEHARARTHTHTGLTTPLESYLPVSLPVTSKKCFNRKYLVCSGEGNGTPLQYSCLKNPMDGGAW